MTATPPESNPDHILDTLADEVGRLLGESVEDAYAAIRPDGGSPDILRDMQFRRVLLAVAKRLVKGPLREAVKAVAREMLVEELPGALAALGVLSDDDAAIVGDGGIA